MTADYRLSHIDDGHGTWYENMFSRGYYRQVWEQLERPMLSEVTNELQAAGRTRLMVDLACGTGRVTATGVSVFERVIGVDVSEEMLATARCTGKAIDNLEFRQLDIRDFEAVGALVDEVGEADLVTAFRLFTNADPELRELAVGVAFRLLRKGGMFVANTHVTPSSPLAVSYGLERYIRDRLRIDPVDYREALDISAIEELFVGAGFSSLHSVYYGALPGLPRIWRHVGRRSLMLVERGFGGRRWNQYGWVVGTK